MYKAIVARIHTRPIPGSDHIVLGSCRGYQVIVNKTTQNGQIGIFFEQGGQLSEEFATTNDLVRRKDADGKPAGGFFEENRRVKALRLRGAKSEGFWCPLEHLSYTGADLSALKEGDLFDAINGHTICQKYVTPATAQAQAARGRMAGKGREVQMFARHIETEAFRRSVHTIPEGAILHISLKLHGTSFRYGHVRESIPLVGWRKWCAKILRRPLHEERWVYVNGTRNVVLGEDGGEAYRHAATRNIVLRRGEVLYGELVGYDDKGQPIMSRQSSAGLKDKALIRQCGDTLTYSYGQAEGTCGLYVYRIVQHSDCGQPVELSWHQVSARCRELGLKTVPHVETFVYDGNADALSARVQSMVNGEVGWKPSALDSRHIEEGVVIRWESDAGFGWLKEKSYYFGVLEGYLKEADTYVDAEEVS